jgi:hypothetical protein
MTTMTDQAARTFTNTDATEARNQAPVPLLIGLTGPSSSGKTFTALRLATGIQSVYGGDIYVVDTEQRRSLHYADRFHFKHVPFGEPFGALDYREALRYCKAQGAGVVVIDSASHEHDGPGGMLEQHEAELTRMAGATDYAKRERMTMLAWQKPKQARRKLITAITTELNMPVIFCFRAKATTKPMKDKADGGKLKPVEMGYMAIAGEEWLFEMALNALFLPGAEGRPTWVSEKPGERAVIKLPAQFKWLAENEAPLNEEVGKRLAEWARGSAGTSPAASKPKADPSLPKTETPASDAPSASTRGFSADKWAATWRERIADPDASPAALAAAFDAPQNNAAKERANRENAELVKTVTREVMDAIESLESA